VSSDLLHSTLHYGYMGGDYADLEVTRCKWGGGSRVGCVCKCRRCVISVLIFHGVWWDRSDLRPWSMLRIEYCVMMPYFVEAVDGSCSYNMR
jgi:hypothetical protein